MRWETMIFGCAIAISVCGAGCFSVYADEAQIKQIEKECRLWAARIKPGQPLTDQSRENAQVVPSGGAVIANYVSGRRTIWLNKNNRIARASCG